MDLQSMIDKNYGIIIRNNLIEICKTNNIDINLLFASMIYGRNDYKHLLVFARKYIDLIEKCDSPFHVLSQKNLNYYYYLNAIRYILHIDYQIQHCAPMILNRFDEEDLYFITSSNNWMFHYPSSVLVFNVLKKYGFKQCNMACNKITQTHFRKQGVFEKICKYEPIYACIYKWKNKNLQVYLFHRTLKNKLQEYINYRLFSKLLLHIRESTQYDEPTITNKIFTNDYILYRIVHYI